ncbi:MAG: DUF1329 domain-containing protein [Candidatus Binataceae bacterium]
MRMIQIAAVLAGLTGALTMPMAARAQVKPGDVINADSAAKVQGLVSPGNYVLVQQGMQMNIVPSDKLEWPPPYTSATEKYHAQVKLMPDGSLQNYVAGQPFPLLDPNDPDMATKIMWNFSFRPLYSDDADLRFPEIAAYKPDSKGEPVGYFTTGHFAFYNNIGRIEVPPVPTDPDGASSGIRYRFGIYPFLEPASMRGYGLIRYRHIDPKTEDNTWTFNPLSRRLKRQSVETLTDAIGMITGFSGGGGGGGGGRSGASGGGPGGAASALVSTLDPDSFFGFSGKEGDYSYKYLGDKNMLACVHAKNSPEVACPFDGGRSVCPENWEMRHLYVVEADAKPGSNFSISKRILYIDSEGWFITASDQYDREGALWKTVIAYNTYRDRPVPDARVAVYPYKRIFQLGLVDEDLTTHLSSVAFMPGPTAPDRECWYIDMGVVDNAFFTPEALENAGH